MKRSIKHWLRLVLFSLLPALMLLLLLELASLSYYFQQRGPEIFGLQAALSDLRQALLPAAADAAVEDLGLPPAAEIYSALYGNGEAGRSLLADFAARYEAAFGAFAEEVARSGARLVVLYIPPTVRNETSRRIDRHDRAFYGALATHHGADFLDPSERFEAHPAEQLALLPHNVHLSRFGNQVLAAAVAAYLQPHAAHRATTRYTERPPQLGDLPPDSQRVWANDLLPFLVTTNGQGLRIGHELTFPAKRQRILLLGDSFTFGINLHDVHTYPALLQALLPEREIVNAGIPGYTILQEAELFHQRARFTEPDIVVLQVLFNDLYGFFYFERNLFSRQLRDAIWLFGHRIDRHSNGPFTPDEGEKALLRQLGMKL